MSAPVVNVLFAPGTNSHNESLWAFERVGADARLLMLRDVLDGNEQLDSGDALCIPGGFAYGDHMGAGALEGSILKLRLAEQLARARTKPIIAICNGFQIAVRAGLFGDGIALDVNDAGTFRNIVRQPHIVDNDTNCVWLEGMQGETLHFPCAHGEGRFVIGDTDRSEWNVALRYPADSNPDNSTEDINGICSPDGLVLGLMNHPERLLDDQRNLDIFANGVKAALALV